MSSRLFLSGLAPMAGVATQLLQFSVLIILIFYAYYRLWRQWRNTGCYSLAGEDLSPFDYVATTTFV